MNEAAALERVRNLATSTADPATLTRFRQYLAIMRLAIEKFGLRRKDAERYAAIEVFGKG